MPKEYDLGATIFEYSDSGFNGNNKELWREISRDMSSAYQATYSYDENHKMAIKILDSAVKCPKRSKLVRYRTIKSNVIRVDNHSVLLELSVGNCFTDTGVDFQSTSDLNQFGSFVSQWVRNTGMIAHKEHIERVRKFVLDADDLGWVLPQISTSKVNTGSVTLTNKAGNHTYKHKITASLSRLPLISNNRRQLVFITQSNSVHKPSRNVIQHISQSLGGPSNATHPIKFLDTKSLPPDDSLALIILPDNAELASSHEWLDYISLLESQRQLFKLVKISTLSNKFAVENIIYDLSMLDGATHWVGGYHSKNNIISVDAGHDMKNQKSLWVSSRFDISNNEIRMKFNTGKLHEDMPNDVFDSVKELAVDYENTFFRDGRFHKGEVHRVFDTGIQKENIFAVTKRPGAVLFRGSIESPQPPQFGDCICYPNGSVLLQSIEPNPKDYQKPIAIRGTLAISSECITDIMTLCKQPTLGLYSSSRLPASIYWADLASKRTLGGWAKAVGRGWGVPDV